MMQQWSSFDLGREIAPVQCQAQMLTETETHLLDTCIVEQENEHLSPHNILIVN